MSIADLKNKVINEIRMIPSRGIKNLSYLTFGSFAAEFINILGFIYIARLLGAKNYGVYVTVSTFVGMFDLVLLEGLNKSVMREGTKDLARMHLQLERTIGIRNALIAAAIVLCWGSSLFAPYDRTTKLYILLFSFQLVYLGLKGFLATIFQAAEHMKYIALFGIVNRVLFVGLSIGALYLGFGLTALFLISLSANLVTLALNYRLSRKFVRFRLFSRIQVDKKILMPGLIFSLMAFVSYLLTRVDLLMISFLGTARDVGVYGVAFRVAEQGVVLRNLIVVAFFPIVIKTFHSGKVGVMGKRLIRLSGLFLVGVFLGSFLLSLVIEDLVSLVFGPEYQASGYILKVLLFYLAFAWASMPFTTAAQATHNEKYLLMISSGMAVLNVLLNYVFFVYFGLIGIAYSTLVVQFLGSLLESVICYRVLRRQGYLV
jgi:O-antigen/teichoic acid export membrane protein